MPLAEKLKKHFGSDAGIWYCSIEECYVILKTDELKEKDTIGAILWGKRTSKDSQIVSPICPFHGRFLNYGESTKESNNRDITLM